MKYKFLRKFLGLVDDERSDGNQFESSGIGYLFGGFYELAMIGITDGFRNRDVALKVVVKDNSDAWRAKIDAMTSSAEYDLTVKARN